MEEGVLVTSFIHHVSSHWRTSVCRVLVCLDLWVSVALGRPCAIQDEELAFSSCSSSPIIIYFHSFDLDFPTECDDEYWFTAEQNEEASKLVSPTSLQQPVIFKQPADKPSLITAFVLRLKLDKVLAMLVKTIVRT